MQGRGHPLLGRQGSPDKRAVAVIAAPDLSSQVVMHPKTGFSISAHEWTRMDQNTPPFGVKRLADYVYQLFC